MNQAHVAFLLTTVAAIMVAPAQAQETKPPHQEAQDQQGDIVVTGSKRDTPFLQSDMSVTVLDRQALEEARVRDFRDIDKLVPNVKFNAQGQLSDMFISVRGIESNPFLVNRTSVYIDGIPFRELSNAVLNQVESVEVLRGPQGALYGANSESGLVLIRTRGPSDHLTGEFRLTGTTFGNGNGVTADGYVAGPLAGDTLAGSLAFKLSREDGYLENLTPYAGVAPRVDQGYVQGRLRWTPTDRLTVNLLAYQLSTRAPGMFEYEYVPLDVDLYNRSYGDSLNGGRRAGDFTLIQDAPKRTTKSETVAGMSATWRLDYGQIDAALSYRRERDTTAGYDLDMTAAPVVAGRIYGLDRYVNAELRFTSPGDKPFTYIVGIAAYDQSEDSILGTIVGSGGLDDYQLAPLQGSDGRDYSIFGTASYTLPFAPRVTMSAGLRYDRARRSTRQTAGQLDLGYGSIVYYRDAELSHTFTATLPRFSLRYQASENLSLYASAAKGYIPGGFNLAAAQNDEIDSRVFRYDSETMWSTEAGFKARLWDGKAMLSGAVFRIRSNNWQEIQVATGEDGRPISSDYIGSDASIESKGFELEAAVQPLPRLSLTGNIGWVDAKYRRFLATVGEDLAGNRVKLTPHYDAYLAARYEHPSGIFGRIDASFTGSYALDERNRAFQPAVTVIGLQLGYTHGPWTGRLFVENLTNERRINGLVFDNFGFGADGNLYGPVDRPRIAGIELSASF